MTVTITGEAEFKNFIRGTRHLANDMKAQKFEKELLRQVCVAAKLYLDKEYLGIDSTQQTPATSIVYTSSRSATIVASGEDVMFIEFGTGTEGLKSAYPDTLPSSGVPITGSWIYNYPSPAKRTAKSGAIYWRVPDPSTWGTQYVNAKGISRGIPSYHQIYDTAIWLEKFIPQLFEQVARSYYV